MRTFKKQSVQNFAQKKDLINYVRKHYIVEKSILTNYLSIVQRKITTNVPFFKHFPELEQVSFSIWNRLEKSNNFLAKRVRSTVAITKQHF